MTVCQKRYQIDDASPFVRTPDFIEHCPQDRDQIECCDAVHPGRPDPVWRQPLGHPRGERRVR